MCIYSLIYVSALNIIVTWFSSSGHQNVLLVSAEHVHFMCLYINAVPVSVPSVSSDKFIWEHCTSAGHVSSLGSWVCKSFICISSNCFRISGWINPAVVGPLASGGGSLSAYGRRIS